MQASVVVRSVAEDGAACQASSEPAARLTGPQTKMI